MNVVKRSLAQRVIALIELARQKVGAAVDIAHVYTNYEIGRMIVEEEQGGKSRADYGKKILIDLSNRLTAHFGRGYSVDNLQRMRAFYLMYSASEISQVTCVNCRQGRNPQVTCVNLGREIRLTPIARFRGLRSAGRITFC